MAYPITVNWPAPQEVVICPNQSGAAAGELTGTLPYIYPPSMGYDRNFRIIFSGNNVGVNFTITGVDSTTGEITSEVIAGQDGTLIVPTIAETSNLYTSIISLAASAAYSNIQLNLGGYGDVWVKLDPHKEDFNVSILTSINGKGGDSGLTYRVYAVNSMVETPTINGMINNIPALNSNLNSLTSAGAATGQAITIPWVVFDSTTSEFFQFTGSATALIFVMGVDSTSSSTESSLLINVLQQGIR